MKIKRSRELFQTCQYMHEICLLEQLRTVSQATRTNNGTLQKLLQTLLRGPMPYSNDLRSMAGFGCVDLHTMEDTCKWMMRVEDSQHKQATMSQIVRQTTTMSQGAVLLWRTQSYLHFSRRRLYFYDRLRQKEDLPLTFPLPPTNYAAHVLLPWWKNCCWSLLHHIIRMMCYASPRTFNFYTCTDTFLHDVRQGLVENSCLFQISAAIRRNYHSQQSTAENAPQKPKWQTVRPKNLGDIDADCNEQRPCSNYFKHSQFGMDSGSYCSVGRDPHNAHHSADLVPKTST